MLIGMQTSAYTPYQAYQAYSRSDRPVSAVYDDIKLNSNSKTEETKKLDDSSEEKTSRAEAIKEEEQKKSKEVENKEDTKPTVTQFTGYTDAQLRQLYQEGRISYQKMNDEIEKRSEERKERTEDTAAAFDKMDDAIISSMVQKTDIGLLLPENFTLDEDEKIGLSA